MDESTGWVERTRPSRRDYEDDTPSSGRRETVIAVDGLTKRYGSGADAVLAIEDLSFEIERGTVVGVLGPNGAGKTTAIKAMLGLVVPDEGTTRIEGIDVSVDSNTVYRHVSAMLEGARNVYWRLTVRENLRFFARLAGHNPTTPAVRARHDRLLEDLDLVEKADVTVNELSRGMKQKASLACTLARETSVIFLDEPTLGLDVESSLDLRRELRRLAERESITIVLSSHDMDVIETVCDRVIVVNEGRIVADDTLADLIDLFRTQAYRVTLEGTLSSDRRDRLAAEFGAENWTLEGGKQRFDATLRQGDDFYAMMDVVRESPCPLVSVTALEPDLEEVFLTLTDGSRTDGGDRRGGDGGSGRGGDGDDRRDEDDGESGRAVIR